MAIVIYTQRNAYCAKPSVKLNIRHLPAQPVDNNLLIIIINNIVYKNTTT